MREFLDPRRKVFQFAIVVILLALFVMVFADYHEPAGMGLASLAIIPVIAGSWYFGVKGGMITALLSVLINSLFLISENHSYLILFGNPGNLVGLFVLIFTAAAVGRLGSALRQRNDALLRLETLEKERQERMRFLELLNDITGRVLEAGDQETMLKILTKHIAELFQADDCFFAFWDPVTETTFPTASYGSMSDIYPYVQFEPGEQTLTASVIKAGSPLVIADVDNSEYMSKKVASIFPSRSMLGLPLIVQEHRSGTLLLGYNKKRKFDRFEYARAQIVAQHIGLVLTKIQLLEEARKQVKQLTVLHEVALVSTGAETEDHLIERVTDIIGRNLYPDNFGIMLLDENTGILHVHPSYRFFSPDDLNVAEVPPGAGITGQVAQTGQPKRIGNVRGVRNYLNVDKRTSSELCVPIKIKERVLGVINAENAKRDAFTADDERLLTTLAGQLATAIEQLRSAKAERQWLDQLARSNDLIYSLAHITTHIEKALDADEIIRTLGKELQNIGVVCAAAFYNEKKSRFTFTYTSMNSQVLEQFESGIGSLFIDYSFSFDSLRAAIKAEDPYQPAVVINPQEEMQIFFPQRRDEMGFTNILNGVGINDGTELMRLPLMFEDQLLGILWVWGKAITKTNLPVMSIFAKQIGISLERARLFAEVQSLALTDPLTGLSNRRSLFELGRVEFSRANHMNRPFCCMMLDLDHFKQVNDNYGHQVGDEVLQEFANRCKRSLREVDMIARYGGEELIILMPETDLNTALLVGERLRKSMAETPIKVSSHELNLTVSIGVAGKDENTAQLETLIARADQAMYIAKHKGRNCVAVSR